MASVLLYPIAYGLELFLASALTTQIAVSLAAVLVSTAAVIYCQRTVALWWSLKSETTQTRTRFIRPHAVVEVKEELHEQADRPRDRGGGQLTKEPVISEKETPKIKEDAIPIVATPIFAAVATRRKLSDDSEGSTEGSTASEDSETRRRKSSSSRDGQHEQSWLNRQPAYMHRSHWVAKPAQPRNNPLLYKPSLVRRASADNNGHHHHRGADFGQDVDNQRKRDDESPTAGEKGREKSRKPTLDRRSSFPSSLPSATFYSQPPKVQPPSSLATTQLTSPSTSQPVATPSCVSAFVQSSSTADDHGAATADGNAEHKLTSGRTEQAVTSPPTQSSPSAIEDPKRIAHEKSKSPPLPSILVMAPATIQEESEFAEPAGKDRCYDSSSRPTSKVSLSPEVLTTAVGPTAQIQEEFHSSAGKSKPLLLPTICVEPDSDRSDSESHSQSEAIISPPKPPKSDEQHFFEFSVKPVAERSSGGTHIEQQVLLPERPRKPSRKDSLGIPSVVKGEIAYPGSQRKRPVRSRSESLTITVQPPVICEAHEAKDQTISRAVFRPIPQRASSLGIPPTFIGEAAFPLNQLAKDVTDNMAVAGALPKKPPGARRKESLEVPNVTTDEVSFPPVSPPSKTLMGPPQERPIKRNRPQSLNIPSLSAGMPDLSTSTMELPMSAPGAKRKHASILKRGNSQEKPSVKKSVTFSPTISPSQIPPPCDSFDRESDSGSYSGPKRPKIYRHFSVDSDSSFKQERYRSSGRQPANVEEAGFLFPESISKTSGTNRTYNDNNKVLESDNCSPPTSSLDGIDDIEMHQDTPDTDENDEVFIEEAAFEISNAKARFLAAGGARAVMSVLCTQDSSDSNSQGTKYSSADSTDGDEKVTESSMTQTTKTNERSETAPKPEKESTITVMPEEETSTRMTTLSSADTDKAPRRTKRFFSNEDLNLRASLLFVETVRSSVESDFSDGRQSHSSEESENSASEDTHGNAELSSESAKSRFLQSCQLNDPTPRHHRFHSDDIWNTPTIPELPEPLEIDSQDEESTSAARDADIEESTSTSSSPSYSSSWYGFLEPDPSRPKLSNLGVEVIESTDNDLSAPIRSEDDTGDEIDDDEGKMRVEQGVGDHVEPNEADDNSIEVVTESEDCSEEVKEHSPESTPIVEEEVVAAAAPLVTARCSGSSTDDVMRQERPKTTSPAFTTKPYRRRQYKTPIILDNGSEVLKAGLADGALPSVSMPAIVGRLKRDIESLRTRTAMFIGNELARKYTLACVDHPMADGLVDNWADLERMWDHVIRKELNVKWKDHPILVTEIASAPARQREKIFEMLFESFRVPACYMVNQGALALHANGETSGLVLSSGSGVTEVIPIDQGCTIRSAVSSLQMAGRGVTRRLQRILMDEGAFTTSSASDYRIVREMKENMAYVCKDYEIEVGATGDQTSHKYQLPDGTSVSLRQSNLFYCTESLFRPSLVGVTYQKGVMQTITECIEKCDSAFLDSVDPTILLAGGNTKLRGFPERLQYELTTGGFNRTVIAHDNRDITTWIGGAILASHSSFEQRWIGCEDYEEYGSSLVHKHTL